MKKIILLLCLLILSGCSGKKDDKISILVPNGLPTIAIGGLFLDDHFNVNIVEGADLITSELLQTNYDIIIAPITAGAKLYNAKATKYQLAAVITFGNTYVVSKSNIPLNSLKDLENKTIAAYGKNNTADIILSKALQIKQVTCNIVYENSVNDVISNRFLTNDCVDYILTAEPALSNLVINNNVPLNIIDLQDELQNELAFIPQAGIFIHDHSSNKALLTIKENINVMLDNPSNYINSIINSQEYFTRLGNDVLHNSINDKTMKFAEAKKNQAKVEAYFSLIHSYNSNLIGMIPDDGFYYEIK